MTFEKLISLLEFDTGEGEILLKLDKNIEESFPYLCENLKSAYLESIDACIDLIKESATIVYIDEELLGLWFCLKLSVIRMHPEYKRRGIGDEYFIAAVANCHRYIAATKEAFGCFGISVNRYVRALSHLIELRAFRIGDFNFEFIKLDSDVGVDGKFIKKGETCLSVHIPINTDISENRVDCNFSLAREFFKKYFGMENPVCQLHSWLIHPSIAECLPEDSRLVKFSKRFSLYEISNDASSAIEYVFGMSCFEEYKRGNRNFERYPEKTTLQRKFKERLIKGLTLGCAKGITFL